MPTNHTPSIRNGYTSIKDFSWSLQGAISKFIKQDKATTALRMKNEGMRTSQIARLLYGEANKTTMTQVGKLLKEVA